MNGNITADQVRRAFRAARVMKWSGLPTLVLLLVTAYVGFSAGIAIGIGSIVVLMIGLVAAAVLLFNRARCPQCGTKWYCSMRGIGLMPVWWVMRRIGEDSPDETEDFKCRQCGLDLGPYLR
jgi:hypothetical protein